MHGLTLRLSGTPEGWVLWLWVLYKAQRHSLRISGESGRWGWPVQKGLDATRRYQSQTNEIQKISISFAAHRLRLLLLFWLHHASGQAGEGRNPTQTSSLSFIIFLPGLLLDPGAQPCSLPLCGCRLPLSQPDNLKLTKRQLKTDCSDHQICSAFVASLWRVLFQVKHWTQVKVSNRAGL